MPRSAGWAIHPDRHPLHIALRDVGIIAGGIGAIIPDLRRVRLRIGAGVAVQAVVPPKIRLRTQTPAAESGMPALMPVAALGAAAQNGGAGFRTASELRMRFDYSGTR